MVKWLAYVSRFVKQGFCMNSKYLLSTVIILCLSTLCIASGYEQQVTADWLLQEKYTFDPDRDITTQLDAAGACDGVIDGGWAFHTAIENAPWWQVDLGRSCKLDKVRIWNRTDAFPQRANKLSIRLSNDNKIWKSVYTHDGTTFLGQPDNKPLTVSMHGQQARYVRIQLPGRSYLHLDEVEIFSADAPNKNIALNKPADQSSISQWSATADQGYMSQTNLRNRTAEIIANCKRLIDNLDSKIDSSRYTDQLDALRDSANSQTNKAIDVYTHARRLQRKLALADPLLDFDTILFTKRVPGSFNHMSDQYFGWWSRPGGGIYLLKNFRSDQPQTVCLTDKTFTQQGSFLRPMISSDATKVLFAWCRHYPGLKNERNKLNKGNVPEDAFYHVYEMNIDGSGARKITQGKYDNFDARYLPDGRIVFLSTRRGHSLQAGYESAALTMQQDDLPDCYVRCGGGPERPCAVYTLHTINADGTELCAISPFEMFEWTPSVADNGTIMYSRWDYIDRDNMPFMSLWAINPDGSNSRLVYSNFTRSPHCTFEPRSIPNSHKIIFTASGHHAQTMGSLVLLDPTVGMEGAAPITRLTPEVCFPEIEGWPLTYYKNPWPLSEELYLVAWGDEGAQKHKGKAANQGNTRPKNGMGIYLFDANGSMELLYRDTEITSVCPIPVKARKPAPVIPHGYDKDTPQQGTFIVSNVYQGLKTVKPGDIKSLRIVAVPPKTHPTMNYPVLGVTRDDPGKCVLGTVPVEADGSAYFKVPSGVIVFFQALDKNGMAVQTMRSTTHVQPGQNLSCVGCHEPRNQTPKPIISLAARREPSNITPAPDGSWPYRFDKLVGPVLDRNCVSCHSPDGEDADARKFNLTAKHSYESLTKYGKPSLYDHVWQRYRQGASMEGKCSAATSELLKKITNPDGHHDIKLDADAMERLITWLDTYGQRLGSFDKDQEQQLDELKQKYNHLLTIKDVQQ